MVLFSGFHAIPSIFNHFSFIYINILKIYIGKEWVHMRKSNTEPIIRIYSESKSMESANALAERIKEDIKAFI